MKIGILSQYNHPFSGYVIRKIKSKFDLECIILEKKGFNEKDKKIWYERTSNKLPNINIEDHNDIEIKYVNNHSDISVENIIIKKNLDLLINLGTAGIIKKNIISSIAKGILNCHPGMLPDYKGCSCVEWALYNNDLVGNSCHLMTENIDDGPIIIREKINIQKNDSYQQIRRKVYMNSIDLQIKALKLLQNKSNFKSISGGTYYYPIEDKMMNEVYKKYRNEN